MKLWIDRPLKFSEILDLTFSILKGNFAKLFLIGLILLTPGYLLQGMTELSLGTPFIGDAITDFSLDSLYYRFETQSGENLLNYGIASIVLMIASMIFLNLIALPITKASIILSVDKFQRNEEVKIFGTIGQALSRYWALIGGQFIYSLIIFSILIGIIVLIVLYFAIMYVAGLMDGLALGINVIIMILLSLGLISVFVYLAVRWGFYFVATVFEKVSPGLGKSWRLTRGNFWRLLGLYLVLFIIISILEMVLILPLQFTFGNNLIIIFIGYLLSIISTIILMVGYTVVYFDLRVRNDAIDLKDMVEQYNEASEKE